MAKTDDRFEVIYKQGVTKGQRILVDKETGVHYLYVFDGYGGGLTVLLDSEGKPVIRRRYFDE